MNGEDERPVAVSVAKIVAYGPISKKGLASKKMKKFVCQKSVAYDAIRTTTRESIELGEGRKFSIKADDTFRNPAHPRGIVLMKTGRFDGPRNETPAAYRSGVRGNPATARRVAFDRRLWLIEGTTGHMEPDSISRTHLPYGMARHASSSLAHTTTDIYALIF